MYSSLGAHLVIALKLFPPFGRPGVGTDLALDISSLFNINMSLHCGRFPRLSFINCLEKHIVSPCAVFHPVGSRWFEGPSHYIFCCQEYI